MASCLCAVRLVLLAPLCGVVLCAVAVAGRPQHLSLHPELNLMVRGCASVTKVAVTPSGDALYESKIVLPKHKNV